MAEKNLNNLLSEMSPTLSEDIYVFVSLAQEAVPGNINPFAIINEDEGVTLILSKQQADQYHLLYAQTFSKITLQVHSDLAAVGLTAAVSTRLASAGISANMIAGFYHDHVFVQSEMKDQAINELNALTKD